jgi:Fe-S oxidoreductase/nitrate reductase gamma subunit
MWNVPHWAEITLYVLIPFVMAAILAGVAWRVRKWLLGQEDVDGPPVVRQLKEVLTWRRATDVVKSVFFQSRLSRDRFAIVMHQAIFWGMVVLFIGTALATVDQDVTNLLFDTQILRGWSYRLFELALDIFGVVLIAGVLAAAYRRYVTRPARLASKQLGVRLWDRFPLLTCLLLIAVTGFAAEGLRIAEGDWIDARIAAVETPEAKSTLMKQMQLRERLHTGQERRDILLQDVARGQPLFPAAAWAPVGFGLAQLCSPLPEGLIRSLHQWTWWLHAFLALGFLVALPFTKAFHLISSPANILLRAPTVPGKLRVAAESGVRTVRDYTWRQLLQVDACTWCGKCEEACPGHHTGFPLSPRQLVLAVGAALLRTRANANGQTPDLHDGHVRPEELWSCCTCRACEDICPVHIEQPRLIIDLRRHLVDQGKVDEGLQDALMNLQRYGNSFGQSPRKRTDWTKSLPTPVKDARKQEVEYLWFVGDYAAYDQRAQAVTRLLAQIFQRAGVDFGLLFEKEQNAGNDARRIGEEGLFSTLRDRNCKELGNAKARTLLTTDPHTYNTLKNEYSPAEPSPPAEDASTPAARKVIHYTELLDELIRTGRLQPIRSLNLTVTYHDPCYLGRFNGVYDAPRRVLQALGVQLVELPRNRSNSFCCGAGGGRIWMKDTPGIAERPAENRVREALALPDVTCLAVACPKDLVMFQDAVKTVGADARLRVADLGELVWEALQAAPKETPDAALQPQMSSQPSGT